MKKAEFDPAKPEEIVVIKTLAHYAMLYSLETLDPEQTLEILKAVNSLERKFDTPLHRVLAPPK